MENHRFIANTSGLCDTCGRSREQCMRRFAKQKEADENQIVSSVVFYQQIPESCQVQDVVCTASNTFLLSSGGQVFSWGDVTYALGRQVPNKRDSARPGVLDTLRGVFIQSISAGDAHLLALTSTYEVFSWGEGTIGQLGHGNFESEYSPKKIERVFDQKKIIKISCGPQTSFANTLKELFAWGSNEDCQLGFQRDVQNKSSPTLLKVPWSFFPEIEILNESRNKTFFYRSIIDQEITPDGVNRREFDLVNSENADLKRRLRTVLEKHSDLEEKLFENKHAEVSISKDTLLDNFKVYLIDAEADIAAMKKQLEDENTNYKNLRNESKELVATIKKKEAEFLSKKIELQQCDHQVKELVVQQEMSTSESSSSLRMKKERLVELESQINELAKERAEIHSKLSLNEGKILKIIQDIEDHKGELIKKEHTRNVYKDIITTRKEQIKRDYLENNQKAVERDILSLIMVNETIEDTALANLSKSVPPTGLINLSETSRKIMTRIKSEINSLKKSSDMPMFEVLNNLWEIIEQNLKLRSDLNELTEGLSMKLSESLSSFYNEEVKQYSPLRMFADDNLEDPNATDGFKSSELALIGMPLSTVELTRDEPSRGGLSSEGPTWGVNRSREMPSKRQQHPRRDSETLE